MVGQQTLINKIKSYSIDTFPHTLLLLGDKGCGKHLMLKEVIAPHLNLDVIDITDNISFEYISEIQLRAVPAIYLINLSLLTEKNQNVILKFIEEPLSNSFIVLLSENKHGILDTIINRCVVYNFEPYTKEQLSSFIKYQKEETKQLALKVCTTPGQVVITTEEKMDSLYDISKKIATKIKDASFPGTLKLAQKINYKDSTDKFDIGVFFNTLIHTLFEEYKINSNETVLKLYYKTVEYNNQMVNTKLNKEILVENFLTTIWKLARE